MRFENWGVIPYEESVNQQLELVQKRIDDQIEDTWVFCSHPPIVTLGRGSNSADLLGWQGEVYEPSRGGKATYHGPSQLVVYPIVKLENRDILKFLEHLEHITIEALKPFEIFAQKSRQVFPNNEDSRIPTGVWVEKRKLASIGIAVKKWVTYHGLALNIDHDPQAFLGINPCGYSTETMTSMEKELGCKIDHQKVIDSIWLQVIKRQS